MREPCRDTGPRGPQGNISYQLLSASLCAGHSPLILTGWGALSLISQMKKLRLRELSNSMMAGALFCSLLFPPHLKWCWPKEGVHIFHSELMYDPMSPSGKSKWKTCMVWSGEHVQRISLLAMRSPWLPHYQGYGLLSQHYEIQTMAPNFCNAARGPKSMIKQNKRKF